MAQGEQREVAARFCAIRSILFVPGDSPRKLARAAGVAADALILDWEDAVAEQAKEVARLATADAMPLLQANDRLVLIRITSSQPDGMARDCEAVAACRPDGIVLPKCEHPRQVELVAGRLDGDLAVVPLVESPLGVLRAAALAACSEGVRALLFGAEDYSAAAGVRRSAGEPELAFARGCVVNAARSFSKEVFDSPSMVYADPGAVREAASRARAYGFTGQAAIHPTQLTAINEAFTPSPAEVAEARAVLARFEQRGGGVQGIGGRLEDMPAARHAAAVLSRVR